MHAIWDTASKTGTGECNGSFGEMLQGVLPGGKKFLINLKIQNRSRVRMALTSCEYSPEKERLFIQSYNSYSKSYKIIRNIMADIGAHDDVYIEVDSNIPVGKGLSSSTADMIASVRALEQALSITLKKEYIGKMLTEVEPNDGLHFPGTAAYHHTLGELIQQFDYIPPLHIIGIDTGGELDTVAFNARCFEWTETEFANYAQLLDSARDAYLSQNLEAVCKIGTQSARLWQKCVLKPELDAILAFATANGALGIANAHSGTFVGLLYPVDQPGLQGIMDKVRKAFPDKDIHHFKTTTCQGAR